MDKKIDFIVESLARKVDSLNYQNHAYNGRVRQEAKDRIKALIAKEKIAEWTVNRFEVIDHTEGGDGREMVKWKGADFKVETSVQDDGRTLKIFLREPEAELK